MVVFTANLISSWWFYLQQEVQELQLERKSHLTEIQNLREKNIDSKSDVSVARDTFFLIYIKLFLGATQKGNSKG